MWYVIFITDKTGNKFFLEHCSESSKFGVIRSLQNHLKNAEKHPKLYTFLDLETAEIVTEEN